MTRKAIILETGCVTEVEKVGENLWLDKSTKEIYKSSELKFQNDIDEDTRRFTNSLLGSALDDIRDQKNRFYEFRADLAITILNRRPFIRPGKLEKLIDKITKITLK